MTTIITRSLQSAQPKPASDFPWGAIVTGFTAKVNSSGSIEFIVEVRSEAIGNYDFVVEQHLRVHLFKMAFQNNFLKISQCQ